MIRYQAYRLACAEALDWEIVQVTFDSMARTPTEKDEENRDCPFLTVSVNFEFSGAPKAEWHDGNDYCGGKIKNMEVEREVARIDMVDGETFEIFYHFSEERYDELKKYLKILFSHSNALRLVDSEGTTRRGR